MLENVNRQQWEAMTLAQQGLWAQRAMQRGAESPLPERIPEKDTGAEPG